MRQQPNSQEELNSRLKLLEIKGSILKSLLWPCIFLLFYTFNFGPINNIIREIPSKINQSDKFSVAGLSIEINQKAEQKGIPELASITNDLTSEEIELILNIGNRNMGYVGTGIKKNEIFLESGKKKKILLELFQKGLIDIRIPMDEYDDYLKKNNIKMSSQFSTDAENYILTDEQMKNNFQYINSQGYSLSNLGKKFFSIVIEVVVENIKRTQKTGTNISHNKSITASGT